MRIVISFMDNDNKPVVNPDNLFGIIDTDTEKFEWIKIGHLNPPNNFVHGMGMCYNEGRYFCAGIIPNRRRLASNLFTIDLSTGEKRISYMLFTKAIHGLKSIDNQRLLACSTQTDLIAELIIENGTVVNEDLYKHMSMPNRWEFVLNEYASRPEQPTFYRAEKLLDDNHHVNSIEVYNGKMICTMFGYRSWEKETKKYILTKGNNSEFSGLLHDLKSDKILLNNLKQPHTAFINSRGAICCCNSAHFTFIVKNKFEVELDGYTRGICEDLKEKGYWVGSSSYRKRRHHDGKFVRFDKGDVPLQGARIQFVNYKGKIGRTIELKDYGQEIFDLLPELPGGKYN